MSTSQKFRLVTRSDFDGLVCAVLLKEQGLIDDILFVHPKDMQDGKIAITDRDITTNLPYVKECFLAFDHHASEAIRHGYDAADNLVLDPEADSAARVVYEYYGGRERFPRVPPELLDEVDKADSARFTKDEVLDPKGWVLLNFIMDPRTGLGRFREFSISNYEMLMRLIDHCRTQTVDEILVRPEVAERAKLYFEHTTQAEDQIRRCARVHGKLVVLDLRNEEVIYACNRFLIYALFPQCNISIHMLWGLKKQNTVFAVGHSIFDRTSLINVGEVMMRYGGGGHAAAGTGQVPHEDADRVLRELILHIGSIECAPSVESSAVTEPVSKKTESPPPPAELVKELRTALSEVASKKDIEGIYQRLERIERVIEHLASVPVRR